MARAFYVIAYDISDDRRRTQVARMLEGYGERVQYSVFEAWLDDAELKRVRQRLERVVKEEGTVRIYSLCATCREKAAVLGQGERTDELDLLII